jgi:hypothetical protein
MIRWGDGLIKKLKSIARAVLQQHHPSNRLSSSIIIRAFVFWTAIGPPTRFFLPSKKANIFGSGQNLTSNLVGFAISLDPPNLEAQLKFWPSKLEGQKFWASKIGGPIKFLAFQFGGPKKLG